MNAYLRTRSTRTFGVEIEFFGITVQTAQRAIQNAGISVAFESYRGHSRRQYDASTWKLTTDGSVNGTGTGMGSGLELVSPILSGTAGLKSLAKALDALVDAGAQIDRSCGVHVHVGMGDLTFAQQRNVFAWAVKNEEILDRLIAPSRRAGNRWCKRLDARESRENVLRRVNDSQSAYDLQSVFGRDRYYKVNAQVLTVHGTIEFRCHQGSLNAEKLCHWVKLLVNAVDRKHKTAARHTAVTPDNAQMLFHRATTGVGRSTRQFFAQRAADFGFPELAADA